MLSATPVPAIAPSTVRAAALDGLDQLVQGHGVDYDALLHSVEIDPALLREADNRLTMRQMARALDAAAAATGDDCLGLHLGAAQSIHMAGVLGYALQASPDVHSQLTQAARYFTLHQDQATMQLEVQGDRAVLRYVIEDPTLVLHRHDSEATFGLCVNQWREHIGQPRWSPTSVHFKHPAPQDRSVRELERFFGCPVHFCEPCDALCFPASFLNTPIRTANPGLHQILSRYAEECLARHHDGRTLAGRVRQLISAGLSSGQAQIETVASQLAMTARTLQRRLADEGQSFGDLLEHTRRELATQYLQDGRLRPLDVAFLLGYSDLTAFHRAFKRWFGQTPLDYQRQVRGGHHLSS